MSVTSNSNLKDDIAALSERIERLAIATEGRFDKIDSNQIKTLEGLARIEAEQKCCCEQQNTQLTEIRREVNEILIKVENSDSDDDKGNKNDS